MSSYLLRPLIDPLLPWEEDQNESSRFKKILWIILVLTLSLSAIIPFLSANKPERIKVTSIPPRLVKMVLEQKKVVKPPPLPEIQKEEEKIEEEPEEKIEKKGAEPEKPKPVEKKTAKDVAKKHIAVFDALADLRVSDDMAQLKNNQNLSNDSGQAATTTRSIISQNATKGSGGIQIATASRSSGSGNLAGQNTTNIKSEIGEAVEKTQRISASGGIKRSAENIQLAFDKYYAQLYLVYRRALRKDPHLQGAVKFNLVIAANGRVVECSILSSQLNNTALEKRLVSKIKKMKFGALNVETWKGPYQISFSPS